MRHSLLGIEILTNKSGREAPKVGVWIRVRLNFGPPYGTQPHDDVRYYKRDCLSGLTFYITAMSNINVLTIGGSRNIGYFASLRLLGMSGNRPTCAVLNDSK